MKNDLPRILHWYRDAIFAGILFLIFAFFLFSSRHIQVMLASSVDAKFFPTVICTAAMVLCAVNIVTGVLRGNAARQKELGDHTEHAGSTASEKNVAVRSALSIALIIVYLILLKPLGFVIASSLYLFIQIMLLSERGKRHPVLYILISIAVSVLCYLFFRNIFYLMLPSGILPL